MKLYDLHTHSSASDGTLTPSQLVEQAHRLGISALALTDHDTVKGCNEAEYYSIEELVWDREEYDIMYYSDRYVVTGHTPT